MLISLPCMATPTPNPKHFYFPSFLNKCYVIDLNNFNTIAYSQAF